MVWTKKASAPAYFNEQAAFLQFASGDTVWEWVVPWVPILPPTVFHTSDFCALGPPPAAAPLSDLDFIGLLPGGSLGAVLAFVGLRPRLEAIALERLFQQFCEEVSTGFGTTQCMVIPPQVGGTPGQTRITLPTGTTALRFISAHYTGAGGFVGGGEIQSWIGHGATLDAQILNSGPGPDVGTFPRDTATPLSDFVVANNYSTADTWTLCFQFSGGTTSYTAPTYTQPSGALPPTTKTYTTIADLGAELDAQELKLDQLVNLVQFLALTTSVPPQISDPPVAADPAAPLITPGAIGYRVDVSGIPVDADESFGAPVAFRRVGRATIGSVNGWLPSFEISHTPFLIAPLPTGVDRIQLTMHPPTTATITALYPA